jgi:WD40 repeat protein
MSTPDNRPPYPGLRPFEADEADLFFGREQHVDALLKRLSNSHFVAVVGESGAGKSSLVRAGLLPALQAGFVVEAGSDWRVAVMRPGGSPMAALADALLEPAVLTDAGGSPRPEFALAELRRGPLGLVQLTRDAYLGSYCNLLVVVDQFEEVFRYCREPAQKDQADMFVELILRAAEQRQVPIFIVLTMRSDFVGDCARFRGLPERLNDNQYLTPRLTREQIAAAIREPARVCGGVVDPALVDELCNAIGDNPDQLPLLQHLLMRVWDRAGERSRPPRLTSDLVTMLGGLYSALNHHAQLVYESLRDDQKAVARAMFKRLTDPLSMRRDLRRDALVSDIAAVTGTNAAEVIAVADVFRAPGRHMLMPQPATPLDAQSRLDISHESLIRQWTTLNGWAREESANAREFRRLRDEAREELEGQADLLAGRDLARALDWVKQAEPTPAWAARYSEPGELETTLAFITRSAAEAQRRKDEQQLLVAREAKAKRQRVYTSVLAGFVVLALVVTGVIFSLWRTAVEQRVIAQTNAAEAEKQAAEAEKQKGRADAAALLAGQKADEAVEQRKAAEGESEEATEARGEAHARQLAADARVQAQNDPGLAILLAGAAAREPKSDEQALDALRVALAGHVPNIESAFTVAKSRHYVPGTKSLWLDFSLNGASVSPRDPVAVVPAGNEAIIWSLASPRPNRPLSGHKGIVGAARFSPDGRLVATSSQDGNGRVWNASTGKLIKELEGNDGMLNDVVFSPDGKRLITLADDHVGRIWHVGDYSKTPCKLEVERGNFLTASFSHDGARLVTVIHYSMPDRDPVWTALVWNIAGDNCPDKPEPFDSGTDARWATFSPYGPWLGIVRDNGDVVMVKTSDWSQTPRITAAPTGTPSDDEAIERKDEAGRRLDYAPPVAWSRDGQYFAAAGKDHTVRVTTMDGTSTGTSLRGHTGRVTSLSFDPSGNVLLSTSNDATARLWRLDAERRPIEVLVLRGHKDGVGSGVFASGGNTVVTAGDDARVRVWRPRWTVIEKPLAGATSVAFTPDATRVRVRVNDEKTDARGLSGWTGEFDAGTMTELNRSSSLPGHFVGTYLVDKATGGELRVRTTLGTGPTTTLAGSSDVDIDDDLVMSSDGRFILSTSGAAQVWDLASPGKPPDAIARPGRCNIKAISSDKRIAWYCAGADRIMIGRAGQATPVTVSIADRTSATAMQFSPSGRLLAVNFQDRSVRLFDGKTGAIRGVLRGHDEPIVRFSFSADERLLLGIGEVRSRIWDLPSGERIAVLPIAIRGTTIKSAVFSPNARSLAFVAHNRVLVWQCEACGGREAMLAEVERRRVDRPLSADETKRFGLTPHGGAAAHDHADGHVQPSLPTEPVAASTTGTRPR